MGSVLLYPALPFPSLPYTIYVPYPTLSYCILLYRIPYPILLYYILPYPTLSYPLPYFLPCYSAILCLQYPTQLYLPTLPCPTLSYVYPAIPCHNLPYTYPNLPYLNKPILPYLTYCALPIL